MPMSRAGYAGPSICSCGGHAFAPATRAGVVLVDVSDAGLLARAWARNGKGYAEGKRGKMHRLLLEAGPGAIVDHINGDKLDNRRSNLRLCSNAESLRNRRKLRASLNPATCFKGVTRQTNAGGWVARICVDGKRLYLGSFASDEAAARAYDEAAIRYHGAFARLNFGGAA